MADGMEKARWLIAEEREKKTGFLDLGNLRLTEIPVEMFELTHLRSLNLGVPYLDEPGDSQESRNDTTKAQNRLTALPTGLRAMDNLVALSIAGNLVSDLAPLQGLSALQSLRCAHTPVSDLAPLQGLSALQSLVCSDTQVSDLAPLQGLSALQSLVCWYTQVSDLAPLIGLPSLRQVVASGCHLSDLPRNLLLHDALAYLILHEASIPGIPPELLSPRQSLNCLDALRTHLTDLEAGTEEVREAKLVVLGNGRVGKTQICRRLRGLAYDDTVPSTHGITVTAEPWSGSNRGRDPKHLGFRRAGHLPWRTHAVHEDQRGLPDRLASRLRNCRRADG